MRYFYIPAAIAVALAVVALLSEGLIIILIVMAGFLAALVTVAGGIACIRAHRDERVDTEGRPRPTRRQATIAGVGAAAILLGYVMLASSTLAATRELSVSTVTSSNLRGIGVMLEDYVDEHGDYPSSLHRLIADLDASWLQLVSVGDPADVAAERVQRGEYSSFEYHPGVGPWQADPRLILAYEREPWTPLNLRVLPQLRRHGRCILFADGRVDCLDADDFRAAVRTDVTRRGQIGWPVPEPGD